MLIVHYTAYLLLLANHEFDKANQFLIIYIKEKNKVLINRFNQNTAVEETAPHRIWYKVNA
jgi:hypothetical protein